MMNPFPTRSALSCCWTRPDPIIKPQNPRVTRDPRVIYISFPSKEKCLKCLIPAARKASKEGSMITLITADGAANGQAAIYSIPELQDKISPHMGAWHVWMWVCLMHLCSCEYMYVFHSVHVCMYARTYAYTMICMYMWVCMRVCVYACMHVCMYVCMYACMYICMHVRMCGCMYVCKFAAMYVFMYVCTHSHMHTHIHTHTHNNNTCIHTCIHR